MLVVAHLRFFLTRAHWVVEEPMNVLSESIRDVQLMWQLGCSYGQVHVLQGRDSAWKVVAVVDCVVICWVLVAISEVGHAIVVLFAVCLFSTKSVVEILIGVRNG